MASSIDPTIPAQSAPLLSPAIRANFAAAANDINAAQALITALQGSVTTLQGTVSGGGPKTYASTTAAQNDGTLANGSYFTIPSLVTNGYLDLYLKVSNVSSTYISTLPAITAVSNIVIKCSVSGGTAHDIVATAPSLTSYVANALFLLDLTTPNDDICTLNVNSIGVVPVLQGDYTALDPGNLMGPTVLMYDTTRPTPCFRVVSCQADSKSMRRVALLNSYLSQQNISNPSTRYSESAKTQTGSTFTFGTSPAILAGRGYLARALGGDVIIAEFVASGTTGGSDAVALGYNTTIFSADYQNLDATGAFLCWTKAGVLQFLKGDGTSGETFSGQITPAEISWSNGDVLRIVIGQAPQGTGGQVMLYRNGDLVGYFTFATTSFVGSYIWAGISGSTSGAAVTVNYARIARPVPGSTRRIIVNTLAGAEGTGIPSSPFKTVQNALRWVEYTADNLEIELGGGRGEGAIGILPVYASLKLRGATAANPFQFYASHNLGIGSGSFTKTTGYTNVYQKAAIFCGITNSVDANSGFIGVSGNPAQSVGAAGKGYTIGHYLYTNLGSCTNATLATRLTALDAAPGSYTNNTDTGVIYINAIGSGGTSVSPDTVALEESRFNSALLIPSVDGLYQGMKFEAEFIDFGFASSTVVSLSRLQIGMQNVTARGSLNATGFQPDTCGGVMRGCRGYGNRVSGLDTFGAPTSPNDVHDYRVLALDDCEMFGNNGNQGAAAHTNTAFAIRGGRYVANGNSGVSSFRADIDGADLTGNGQAGAFYLQLANIDLVNKVSGCEIRDNAQSGLYLSSNGLATGTLTVEVDGGTHVNGSGSQHVLITGTAGHASATTIKGALLQSGTSPPSGNVVNTNGTNALTQPAYV